jgi:3-dehydroquinate synthase
MSPLNHLTVSLEERSYDILVGNGLLAQAGEILKPLLKLPRVFILTDETVAKHHLGTLETSLNNAGIKNDAIILPPGENTKRFEILERVMNTLLEAKPERSMTLIALGGGVVGDLTGFAASILLRGVPFIQIPTTLLAQVDSSVGGKTGINTPYGKNLVGTFYQPSLVLADMELLGTLPTRELLAGYAEVVKYGLINQPDFFTWLEGKSAALKAKDRDTLSHMVLTSCKAKADIVASDERESGARALLNLGHTFGHALEKIAGYDGRLLHGEAVALGMAQAFRFSTRLGLCPEEDTARVEAHLKAVGLPVFLSDIAIAWEPEALLDGMYQDKKVSGGKLVFILVKGIGKAYIAKDIIDHDVLGFLNEEVGRKH